MAMRLSRTRRRIGRQHQVFVNDHSHREARTDRQRRLHIYVTTNQLLTNLARRIAATLPDGLRDGVIIIRRAKLRSDTQQRRQSGAHEQLPPMIVDFILQPGKARSICSCLAAPGQSNARSVE